MKQLKKSLVLLLLITFLLGTQHYTFAWLTRPLNANLPNNFSGSTEIVYFESGDGSPETPYVISSPVHLYNFAWLQYLGYFNLGTDINNNRVQNYFVLKNNIDMNDVSIPPIGTEEYPFLGNFNGQGFTVSNCVTANSKDLLPLTPATAKFDVNDLISAFADSTDDVAQVIGFFGVIGDYNGAVDEVISKIDDTTTGTISADAISGSNFYLNNISVKTNSSNTTVGIAAGYVNAEFKGVGVCNSNIYVSNAGTTSLSDNISDYTLVGYCTGNAKTTLNVRNVKLSVPKTFAEEWINEGASGSEAGWGGSVDMIAMHARLQYFRSNSTTNSNYVYDRYIEIGVDGQTNTLEEITGTMYTSNSNPAQGNFVFSSTSSQYTYLHGGTTIYETKYELGGDTTAYLISDSGGRYLSVNGTSITSTTNSAAAAKWFFSDGLNGGYISTVTDGFMYYLTNNNGTLSLSRTQVTWWNNSDGTLHNNGYYINYGTSWQLSATTNNLISDGNGNHLSISSGGALTNTTDSSSATVWNFASPGGSGRISAFANGTTYYLLYDNGLEITTTQSQATSWIHENGNINYNGNYITYNGGWQTTTTTTYYISDGNGNYLTLNGTTLTNTTSKTSATVWTFSEGASGGYISSGNIYLRYSSGLITGTSTNGTSWTFANNRLSYTYWYSTYYIKCNNGTWSASTGTTNATLSVFPPTDFLSIIPNYTPLSFTQTTGKAIVETNRVYVDNTGTNITYFPLQVNETNNDYQVIAKNTGYIISSSQDRTTTGTYPDKSGDIRVSYYSSSSISSTYLSNGIINRILTVNDSGNSVNITSSTAYEKLSKAKESFEAILSQNTSSLYGLHFMNANVSMNNLITVPSAVINDDEYTNYQMPTDCVDFRLKEKGYINFFAGTYFPSNNSFFSLYDIFRDEDHNITDIKRIVEIYGDDAHQSYSYVYKYEDGSFSDAYQTLNNVKTPLTYTGDYPAGYTSKFKTSWIEKNNFTDDALYYFELPVNDGEYALGSTDGGIGSYLMYLDIGANAQTVERTIISETITTVTDTHSHASGVGVVESTPYVEVGTIVTDSDAISYKLPANSFGTLQISRTGNAVTLSGIEGITRFIADGLTLNESSTATPDSSVTSVEKRLTYVDYNIVTEETIITIISQIDNDTPTMIVIFPDGTTSTDPYRNTSLHTDSVDDLNSYYQPSTVTLLQYNFSVHEDAQVNIEYESVYQGSQGYIITALSREMLITSTEDTVAEIITQNFIEDSGNEDNYLSTTEVTVTVIVTE